MDPFGGHDDTRALHTLARTATQIPPLFVLMTGTKVILLSLEKNVAGPAQGAVTLTKKRHGEKVLFTDILISLLVLFAGLCQTILELE